MRHRLGDHLVQVVRPAGVGLADPAGAMRKQHQQRIERAVRVVVGRGRRAEADRGQRGSLPLGQTVDAVVEKQVGDVHVAPRRVRHVAAADGEAVAVAAHHHHRQRIVGRLDAGGHRQRASVQGVHAVGVHEEREARGTADAGHHHGILVGDVQLAQRGSHRLDDGKVAAARAPGRQRLRAVVEPPAVLDFLELFLKVDWFDFAHVRLLTPPSAPFSYPPGGGFPRGSPRPSSVPRRRG